ncbi:hypothetical protein BC89_32355, partial [Pseudomonas monteilii]
KSYTITLPSGTAKVKVGGSEVVVTDNAIDAKSGAVTITGPVTINGTLLVTGDINGGGRIIDTAGNTANHKH